MGSAQKNTCFRWEMFFLKNKLHMRGAGVRRAVALGGPYPARPIPHALAPHAHDRVVDVQPERVRRCPECMSAVQ